MDNIANISVPALPYDGEKGREGIYSIMEGCILHEPALTRLGCYASGGLRDTKFFVKQASVDHALREDTLDPLSSRQCATLHSTC